MSCDVGGTPLHSLFSNPSATSATSQLILQSFHCFTYVTWRAAHGCVTKYFSCVYRLFIHFTSNSVPFVFGMVSNCELKPNWKTFTKQLTIFNITVSTMSILWSQSLSLVKSNKGCNQKFLNNILNWYLSENLWQTGSNLLKLEYTVSTYPL